MFLQPWLHKAFECDVATALIDIISTYTSITVVQSQLKTLQAECDKKFAESVWRKASELAAIADTELTLP